MMEGGCLGFLFFDPGFSLGLIGLIGKVHQTDIS